ncbi:MAG: response regulator [Chloroflexi bacterium]|nr:response regulator [Chloroflexota bacterium]
MITYLVPDKRRVELSIQERLHQLVKAEELWSAIMFSAESEERPRENNEIDPRLRREKTAPLSEAILFIDDHGDIAAPYAELLRKKGYVATGVTSVQEAMEALERREYGVLFVDINLSRGEDGLGFIAQLKAKQKDMIFTVMSLPQVLEQRAQEIESLGVHEVFPKPFDMADIEEFLYRVGSGEPLEMWRARNGKSVSSEDNDASILYPAPLLQGRTLEKRIERNLRRLQRETKADAVFLFHMDITARTFSISARVGQSDINQQAIYVLAQSPVKDVILENSIVFDGHASSKEKFGNLLKLLPFESCIGVPIAVRGEIQYAVFLFDRAPDAFSPSHLKSVVATAYILTAVLEFDLLMRDMRKLNALLISGQLAAGLSHEVGNKITGLGGQISSLQYDCEELARKRPDLAGTAQYQKMKGRLNALTQIASDLKSTVELFQHLFRPHGLPVTDANTTLRQTIRLLKPTAERHGVELRFNPEEPLPPVSGDSATLQQVFYNVVLNGIQHLGMSPMQGGVITIETGHTPENHDRPVQVRFSDNGLGIHRTLWERIFQMGFSTRPDGTGLGLFIARNLVESLGGALRVESSFVPGGTTFLVELPVVKSSKSKDPMP